MGKHALSGPTVGRRMLAPVLAIAIVTGAATAGAGTFFCVGDCNGDFLVSSAESTKCMAISLGQAPLSDCPRCDADGNGSVTSGDLGQVNRNRESGCPLPPTPTPTPTSDGTETMETFTPTRTPTRLVVISTPTTVIEVSTPTAAATATPTAVTEAPTVTRTATAVPTGSVEIVTTLSEPIAVTADMIPLDDVTGLPPSGVVQIDEELILYSEIVTTAVLSGAGQPGILVVAQRGFMGTPIQEHEDEGSVRFVPPPACVGDCDGGGTVSIGELIRGVSISLGNQAVTACLAMDGNLNGRVAINELIRGVNNSLQGCGE